MTKQPGSLGGRDDVHRPEDLPDLDRWQPVENQYREGKEIGDPDRFPTRGHWIRAELVATGEQVFPAVTEGLDRMMVEKMEEEGVPLTSLTVDVDTAEKAGEEETSPWRYTASIVLEDELGPPEDSE